MFGLVGPCGPGGSVGWCWWVGRVLWGSVVGALGFCGGLWGGSGASGCGRVESGYADQVVAGGGDEEPGPVALSSLVAEFSSSGDGLDPAEGLLDAFAGLLGDGVSDVAGGASIDRGAASGGVLARVCQFGGGLVSGYGR